MSDSNRDGQQRLILVSGLSGAGKSVALHTFEDLGYYCVDNLPAQMLPAFLQTFRSSSTHAHTPLAVGIDARSHVDQATSLANSISNLREDDWVDVTLVFFDSSEQVLLQRYADSRRRHPLSVNGVPLLDAIRNEMSQLALVKEIADVTVDTSHLNVHQLRRTLRERFRTDSEGGVTLLFESFAYRRGVPSEADLVFDARALTNPHWNAELRPMTGLHPRIREFLLAAEDVQLYVKQVDDFLSTWIPKLATDTTRSYITVAFGCSGGKHRSVFLADHFAKRARELDFQDVAVNHREID